ncbi:MAG: hypothetical protein PHF86_15015 [Candidatus Nanoarchaeia archaeon]|jgi:hypothetical protein|nr:hypothetical protein [Candidatus Nanoarchaeia archaeon]
MKLSDCKNSNFVDSQAFFLVRAKVLNEVDNEIIDIMFSKIVYNPVYEYMRGLNLESVILLIQEQLNETK